MSNKSFEQGDPQFCIIAPTAYLDRFARSSTCHLVLAHIVDTNPEYAKFYADASADGDRIIMDNGAFELGQSYAPDKLISLGKACGADAIVLPDYPGQAGQITIDAAIKWGLQIKDAGFKTMFVPQSKVGDKKDWISTYKWAGTNENIDIIGMSILGIPNAIPYVPAAYARVVMTELLRERGVFARKYHHYLGLNAGPALEIPALLNMEALDSLDSSNPVWCGVNGIRYDITTDSLMPISKKYLREVDFNEKMTKKPEILECIKNNIELTLALFR